MITYRKIGHLDSLLYDLTHDATSLYVQLRSRQESKLRLRRGLLLGTRSIELAGPTKGSRSDLHQSSTEARVYAVGAIGEGAHKPSLSAEAVVISFLLEVWEESWDRGLDTRLRHQFISRLKTKFQQKQIERRIVGKEHVPDHRDWEVSV